MNFILSPFIPYEFPIDSLLVPSGVKPFENKKTTPLRGMVDNRLQNWEKTNHPIRLSNNPIQYSYQIIISNAYPINILVIPY